MARERDSELVLVGGGHAHVQVLRHWMMEPLDGVHLTVVLDRPVAVYSGMVPGFVAGDYAARDLEIDVVPLARRAGARVLLAAARGVDPAARAIELEGRPPIPYDVASLDIGSTVRGLELPGVREHALATRPISSFVARLEAALRRAAPDAQRPLEIAVVGGGAAGVELAFTLEARLRRAGQACAIALFAEAGILPGEHARVSARARALLAARGIALRADARAVGAEKGALLLERGRHAADLIVWATGAAPLAFDAQRRLPRDAAGFIAVAATLEVEGCAGLFAVGDCAGLRQHPWLRKAGVYAVRQGPYLDANLRARLCGRAISAYPPQRDFLALLNLGDQRALGSKWGRAVAGPQVWRAKDWIDRRFMRRFQVLGADGAPAPQFPRPEAMDADESEPMECGGCAAKLGARELARALARLEPAPPDASVRVGLAQPDDAAALVLPGGDVLLATLDAFRPFTDDPWLVGRVAAVNAASDVFAKGGTPRHALALVTLPGAAGAAGAAAEEILYQVLAGVRAGLDALGASLVGGHTTSGRELFVGLAITGELGGREPLGLAGLAPGDALVLSKPLGTGVVLAADARGLARGAWLEAALASMLRSNAAASRVAREQGSGACTDVSGFGLVGHLAALLAASGVSAQVDARALPALDGALDLLRRGARSTFHAQNTRARAAVELSPGLRGDPRAALVFDPQTSGGLLFGVPAARAAAAVAALRAAGDAHAAVIGRAVARAGAEPAIEIA